MVRAKKSLGQNFLVDRNYQQRIVTALEAQPEDVVLEIGPGTGALTDLLAGTVRRLVAVEKDDALASALAERYAGRADVEMDIGEVYDAEFDAREPGEYVLTIATSVPPPHDSVRRQRIIVR